MHRQSYRPQPSLRREIRKENGKTRPLGIAAVEDKVVQRAVVMIQGIQISHLTSKDTDRLAQSRDLVWENGGGTLPRQMNLTLRKATADDAAAAWEIRNAAICHACRGFYADEWLTQWTAGDMTDPFVQFVAQQFHVATVDGVIAGTGMIDLGDGRLDADLCPA